MRLNLPLPSGVWGSYTIEVYRDGNVAYTQSVARAETVAGSSVSIDISGKKTETLTINIRNDQTNQTVQYARYTVDYDKQEITLEGSLNDSGLLAITPETTTTTTTPTTTTTTTSESIAPPVDESSEGAEENQY